jgi:hypothetical protein
MRARSLAASSGVRARSTYRAELRPATATPRWANAGGLSKTTLTIPEAMTPTDLRVRLIAEPIGGNRPIATPVLIVPAGQRIYWSIGSDPATSTASAG